MTLYEEIKATGGYIANHESDLYIEVNEANRAILKHHPLQDDNKTTFRNQVTGKPCWDIPFAFDPWWLARAAHWQADAEEERTSHKPIPHSEAK